MNTNDQQRPEAPELAFGNKEAPVPLPTTTSSSPPYSEKHRHDHHQHRLVRTEKQQRRLQLALFIKILLKTLKEENEVLLHQQVRMVISMCMRGHKLVSCGGGSSSSGPPPLEDILEAHLRPLVGESHWQRASYLQRHYLEQKCRPQNKAPSPYHYSSAVSCSDHITRTVVPI